MEPESDRDEMRVNGFAKGDRVTIVDGTYKGYIGKVWRSANGCNTAWCRENCALVRVELTHKPRLEPVKDVGDHFSTYPDFPANSRPFLVRSVTHID